jgi:hypothetical protein
MKESSDNESELDIDALTNYDDHIEENIGLALKKRPSAKQKVLIVDRIKESLSKEEDLDYDSIFVDHARNCFEPLYFEDKRLFYSVENIMVGFLPTEHPRREELYLNDEDPPLHIGQLLKKPSFETLAEVVKSLREDDPGWNWYADYSGARKLVLVLGNNFQELIKQNSHNKIIFEDKFPTSKNRRPPPAAKAKRAKRGRGPLVVCGLVLIILWVFNPFRSSPQSSKTQEDETAQPQVKSEATASSKQDETAETPLPITTLENVVLPIKLVSTEEFSLLNKSGEQNTIPTGSIITVESRGASGTLTTRINGEIFVGNEQRLSGKTKVKAD